MTTRKQRLSVSVDAELVEAAERAVSNDRAPTVSAWVNDALRLKLEHDRRLSALAELVRSYEDEHGAISEDEVRAATRRARARAISARSLRPPKAKPSRRGPKT